MSSIPGITALGISALLVAGPASAEEPVAQPPRASALSSCVAKDLSVPDRLLELLPDRTKVWFDLEPDGRITHVRANDLVSREIAPFVRDAIERCGGPASDAQGHLARVHVAFELRAES